MKILLWDIEISRRRRKLLKSIDELTSDNIKEMKLKAIRNASHRAVDMGLYDKDIKEIK